MVVLGQGGTLLSIDRSDNHERSEREMLTSKKANIERIERWWRVASTTWAWITKLKQERCDHCYSAVKNCRGECALQE